MSGDGKTGRPGRRPRAIERPRVPAGPLADLKALLYELYLQAGTPTLDEMAAWVAADDELAGAPGRDTIGRVIGDPGLPASQADVVAVVTVLARAARWDRQDAAGRARDLWVGARMASARSPAAGIRASEADPRRLGAHAAISVSGVPDEIPPEYVPRDVDDGEFGVRAKVAAAARRGGFVLLVGGRLARLPADLLADRRDLDGLRARADAGDGYAAWRLADLLADCGDLDGLRARADAGDEYAARGAGQAAGPARRPERAARPGRRRRHIGRRAADPAAGRPRRRRGAARTGRRGRHDSRRAADPAAGRRAD